MKNAVLLMTCLVCLGVSAADNAEKKNDLFPEKIAARAKGVEITQSQVDDAFIDYRASLAVRGETLPEAQRATVEKQLMERLVVTQLLLKRATDADRKKGEESTEKVVEDMRKRASSEEVFKQQLRAVGMTVDSLRKRILEQSTCEHVLERELKSSIVISDDEARKFYDENPTKFEQPETVHVSHILLSTIDKDTRKPLPAAQRKEKEDKAKQLRQRALEEDFAKLAKENSEDPGSKDKGGEYTFGRGQMVKEFETAAFSLKPGQISDVVETAYGYHIIKLHERIPAKKSEFEKVAPEIKEALAQREMQKQLPAFFDKLKKESDFEIVGQKKNAAK
jgi:peptidyl-prolyl cis-trans isomerase C